MTVKQEGKGKFLEDVLMSTSDAWDEMTEKPSVRKVELDLAMNVRHDCGRCMTGGYLGETG